MTHVAAVGGPRRGHPHS